MGSQARKRAYSFEFSSRVNAKKNAKKNARFLRPAGTQTNKACPARLLLLPQVISDGRTVYLRILPPLSLILRQLYPTRRKNARGKMRRLPGGPVQPQQPSAARGRHGAFYQLFFAGKTNHAAHDVQPQGGGTAAENAGVFFHGRVSLLFRQQYAPKKGKQYRIKNDSAA